MELLQQGEGVWSLRKKHPDEIRCGTPLFVRLCIVRVANRTVRRLEIVACMGKL
jgi:hypothetical protein